MNNQSPIISIRNLSKTYRIGGPKEKYKRLSESVTDAILHPGKWLSSRTSTQEMFYALKDVSFDVYPGEVVGIIGRNGAGKSTLLKILSGITYPSSGEIELNGRVGSLLEVGTGFHPELTGRENIYFNGSVLGMTRKEIDEKFDEIVKFAGMDKFLDTPVKRYSSGMSVRLGFAVAAHLDPEILVVDEVLAVGDMNFRQKCLGKMKSVSSGGRTVIYVSHDMSSIRSLCSKVLWIDKGEIVLEGSPDSVSYEYEKNNLISLDSSNGHFDRIPIPKKDFFIEWVELRDKQGNLNTNYIFGDSMEVVFSLHGQAPQDSYTVEYLLFNESGNRISFGTANPLCNVFFDRDARKISCMLSSLPLTMGSYRFYFSVRIWGLSRWDEWDSNVGFRILHSDPNNTGHDVPGGVNGDFILDQHWSVIDH